MIAAQGSEPAAFRLLRVDIVVPVFNEDEAVQAFHQQLAAALDALQTKQMDSHPSVSFAFQVIYVNDGSRDHTQAILEAIAAGDERVRVIELSRNFGHQAALTAGLDAASGDYVISMDGDGQHPPALLGQMLELALSGYDVVLTQRLDVQQGTLFKRWTSDTFYRLINRVGDTRVIPGAADFRLLSRRAADGLGSMREYHRFLRGMVAWMGYRTVILPFTPPERLGGKTKYSLAKMLNLARNAIFSFSLAPLYIGLSFGVFFLLLALLEAFYVLSFWVTGRQALLEPGWSSTVFLLLIVGGVLMILLGFIGVYVGLIFQEVKGRPIYLVRQDSASQNPSTPDQPVQTS